MLIPLFSGEDQLVHSKSSHNTRLEGGLYCCYMVVGGLSVALHDLSVVFWQKSEVAEEIQKEFLVLYELVCYEGEDFFRNPLILNLDVINRIIKRIPELWISMCANEMVNII